MNALFQLASVFYSEADTYRATVEKIIETVHSHTFAVELAAKLLENGISTPDQLLTRLQVEKASFHNEDKIKIIKDGQSSKATYYSHIHTLFSLYTLSLEQQDIISNIHLPPKILLLSIPLPSLPLSIEWLKLRSFLTTIPVPQHMTSNPQPKPYRNFLTIHFFSGQTNK